MKSLKAVPVLIGALAVAGCAQSATAAPSRHDVQQAAVSSPHPPPPATPVTTTLPTTTLPTTTASVASPQVTAHPAAQAVRPPAAPTAYVPFDYELPAHPPAGGSAINMAAPAHWSVGHDGPKTDYRDQTGQLLVQFQWAQHEPHEPDGAAGLVALLRAREQATEAQYRDYRLIGFSETAVGPYHLPAGEWRFTFESNGVTRLVRVVGLHFTGDDLVTTYVSGPQRYSALTGTILTRIERNLDVAG
jgi:hypothetical protein